MLEGLFPDLEYYGIRPPRHIQQAIAEKEYMSHQVYWILYQFSHAANFNTTVPPREELDWMSQVYPDTFDRYYRPLWSAPVTSRPRFFFQGLPMLCQVCQIPMGFTEPGDPSTICASEQPVPRRVAQLVRRVQVDLRPRAGEVRAGVAARAPDLPGQLRGTSIPEVLDWYGIRDGAYNGQYLTSPDKINWDKWHSGAVVGGAEMTVKALYEYDFFEGPPGTVRRRHPGQRSVDEQHDVRLGRLL